VVPLIFCGFHSITAYSHVHLCEQYIFYFPGLTELLQTVNVDAMHILGVERNMLGDFDIIEGSQSVQGGMSLNWTTVFFHHIIVFVAMMEHADHVNEMTTNIDSTNECHTTANTAKLQKVCAWLSSGLHKAILIADCLGEKIAGVLGITDSRFQYAIDECDRIERLKKQKSDREMNEKSGVSCDESGGNSSVCFMDPAEVCDAAAHISNSQNSTTPKQLRDLPEEDVLRRPECDIV
jgi:hypothetical protein